MGFPPTHSATPFRKAFIIMVLAAFIALLKPAHAAAEPTPPPATPITLSKDIEAIAEFKALAYFRNHPGVTEGSPIDLTDYDAVNGSPFAKAVIDRINYLIEAKQAGITGDYKLLLAAKFSATGASEPPEPPVTAPKDDQPAAPAPADQGPADAAPAPSDPQISQPGKTTYLPASAQTDEIRDVALHYLKRNTQRYSMVKVEDWLRANFTPYPSGSVDAIKEDVRLAQGLVSAGLQAKSTYFARTFDFLEGRVAEQKALQLPEHNEKRATKEAESAVINTAVKDFATGKTLAQISDTSLISQFEVSSNFTQGSLVELCNNFEKTLKRNGAALAQTVAVTSKATAGGSEVNSGSLTDLSATATKDSTPAPTATANSDNVTAAPAASTGSVSQYFQGTKINISNRATLVQEELASGYMKIFGSETIGYKIEGSLPVSSSTNSSTSAGTAATTTSATPSPSSSTPDFVTAELLLYNGGLFNFWVSPLQLATNESPQGFSGRQYESDRYYLSYWKHSRDANGNPVPPQDRYDESSLLLFLADGLGVKGYQKTAAASTTSSSVPALSAAGEAFLGLGVDGPTFDGLTSKEGGYISMQVIGGLEVINRNTVNQVFSTASGVATNSAQTVFETAEAQLSYVDGSWTISAFYTVPLDQHTRSLMRDAVGFSLSWNGKSTNPTSH